MNDGVDNLRADEGDPRRQYARGEREDGKRDAERLVGGPHQQQRAAAVGKNAEPAALQAA